MNISFNLDSTDIHEADNAARAAKIMRAIADGLTGSAAIAEAAGIKPAKAAPAKTTRKKAPKKTADSPAKKSAPKAKAATVEIPVKEMAAKPKRTNRKRTNRKRKTTYSADWLVKALEADAGFKREEGAIVDPKGFGSFLAEPYSSKVWNRARLACAMMVCEKTDGASLRREFANAQAWGVMPKPGDDNFRAALAAGAVTVEERMGKLAKALNINRETVAAEADRVIPRAK